MKSPDCVEDEMMQQSRWPWPKVSTLGPAATGLTDSITSASSGKAGERKWFVGWGVVVSE